MTVNSGERTLKCTFETGCTTSTYGLQKKTKITNRLSAHVSRAHNILCATLSVELGLATHNHFVSCAGDCAESGFAHDVHEQSEAGSDPKTLSCCAALTAA